MSDWKSCGKSDTGSDYTLYVLDDQDADERIDLGHDAWLLVRFADEINVEFAAFDFHDGPSTKNGEIVAPKHHMMLFKGVGPSGSLRECRHIWWGDPDDRGYTHCLHFATVEAAFRELRRWFDEKECEHIPQGGQQ